jgi:hypothetical protein
MNRFFESLAGLVVKKSCPHKAAAAVKQELAERRERERLAQLYGDSAPRRPVFHSSSPTEDVARFEAEIVSTHRAENERNEKTATNAGHALKRATATP